LTPGLTCLYATDAGFLPMTCFSVRSLVARASIPLTVTVLTAGLSAEALTPARRYLDGLPVTFVPIPCDAFDALPRPPHLPLVTYGRLLLDRLLPGSHDRVLYLDGDTLVEQDVAQLAATPLHGATLGAVLDFGRVMIGRDAEARSRLDLGPGGDYFNAGVLLIDWAAWRERAVGENCLSVLQTEPDRFVQRDQCALNYVCRGHWEKLDVRWNYQPVNMLYAEQSEAIFHFLGGRKPWQPGHRRHAARFVNSYADLFASSPWAASGAGPVGPLGATLRDVAARIVPRYWLQRETYHRVLSRYMADVRHRIVDNKSTGARAASTG